jgi:nitrogen PTS system EIIA component
MSRLATILPLAHVIVDLDAPSKKRVFEHAGLLFENEQRIARAVVTDNLFARERLGSTGLGHGFAVPHGRIKGLKQPQAALLRLRQPIPFDAPDEEPVQVFFVLLMPETDTQRHLDVLADVAHMLSDKALRDDIKRELDRGALHQRLVGWAPLRSVA